MQLNGITKDRESKKEEASKHIDFTVEDFTFTIGRLSDDLIYHKGNNMEEEIRAYNEKILKDTRAIEGNL